MASLRTLFVSLLAALTLAAAPTASAIVGGKDDKGHDYVVFVGQQVVLPNGMAIPTQACSGTLVAPTVVVTAAHCWLVPTPSGLLPPTMLGLSLCTAPQAAPCVRWVVRQGQNMRAATAETAAAAFDTHPQFCASCDFFANHDLGVITLASPLSGPFAKLPKADRVGKHFSKQKTATIVGYGLANAGDPPTSLGPRRFAHVEALLFGANTNLLELPSPAKPTDGVACASDSGGPVLKGKAIQAVLSFGDDACGGPTYAYRLDTPSARSFLANYVDLKGAEASDGDERDDN